jgi:hypothetical protein
MSATVVTAADCPLVSAENLTATLQGFTLRGPAVMTTAIGLQAASSHLTLTQLAIHSLVGRNSAPHGPGHVHATGIYLTGTGNLTADNLHIYDLTGGMSGFDTFEEVGTAVGLLAEGNWQITIRHGHFSDLQSGSIYTAESMCGTWPYYANGIRVEGNHDLIVEDSHFERVTGGSCGIDLPLCDGYLLADNIHGIFAQGGQLAVSGSTFRNFSAPVDSAAMRAVQSYGASLVTLTGNVVENLADLSGDAPPTTPNCPPGGYSLVGLEISNAQSVHIENNLIQELYQPQQTDRGATSGIRLSNVQAAQIFNNLVQHLVGPGLNLSCSNCSQPRATGIQIESSSNIAMNANLVGNIRGGDAISGIFNPHLGSTAGALFIENVSPMTLTNNILYAVAGGQGNSDEGVGPTAEGPGGDAGGVYWFDSSGLIANNTLYYTIPGLPGDTGQPGLALGIYLDGQAVVYNNALVRHGIALSVTAAAAIDNA